MSEQSTGKKSKKGLIIGVIAALVVLIIGVVAAVVLKKEVYRTLEIIECYGSSTVHRDDKTLEAYEGMKLRSGDHVSVNENSYVRMCFDGDKYVYLEGQALMKLVAAGTQKDSRTAINLELGTMVTELTKKLSDKASYEINSPNTTMAIRGTITVSEVRYELTEAIKEAVAEIKEADILTYLINTKTKKKAESAQKDEEVKKVFEQGVKAKVSSYVQQGKVELTVFEKTREDGQAKVVATALPLEKGNGVASVVEEIIETEVLNVLEVAEDGTLAVKDTDEAKEIVKDIVVETERKQVETVEELETVVQTNQVNMMENLDEVQLQLDLEELSVSDVKEDLVAIWDKALGNWNPNESTQNEIEAPTPTEIPIVNMAPQETLAPTPTEVPVATMAPQETLAPTPTEIPVATMAPQETLAPTPTEIPVATMAPQETLAPTPTEVPVVTEVPSPSPSPSPTVTPSPSPSPTVTPSPSPTVTPSPSPTEAPTAPPAEANFTYSEVEADTIRLDSVADPAASEIIIPGYVDGKKVVSAGSEIFSGCSALTTVRLQDDVDPESNLLIELITAALPCMKLRQIYLPISYEQYLTEDLPIDQVQGVTLSTEGDSMVIRLQTSLLFLAPKLMELMQQYQ